MIRVRLGIVGLGNLCRHLCWDCKNPGKEVGGVGWSKDVGVRLLCIWLRRCHCRSLSCYVTVWWSRSTLGNTMTCAVQVVSRTTALDSLREGSLGVRVPRLRTVCAAVGRVRARRCWFIL